MLNVIYTVENKRFCTFFVLEKTIKYVQRITKYVFQNFGLEYDLRSLHLIEEVMQLASIVAFPGRGGDEEKNLRGNFNAVPFSVAGVFNIVDLSLILPSDS